MKQSYRAMPIIRTSVLEPVERPALQPGAAEVLIEVEACGLCGADLADLQNADPALQPPRMPGHEVVGPIEVMPLAQAQQVQSGDVQFRLVLSMAPTINELPA